MGLASSQARLLNLTTRMHQIEYNAQRIEAMKLQMANESRQVYLEYSEALEQSKVQIKTLNSNGAATYVDITNYDQMLNAGFAICVHGVPISETPDANGVYQKTDTTGNKKGKDGTTVVNDYTPAASVTNGAQAITGFKDIVCTSVVQLQNALGAKYNTTITLPSSAEEFRKTLNNIMTLGDVTIVENIVTPDGKKYWPDPESNEYSFSDFQSSIATNTSFQEVTDESGLRKAEAKYEADMRRIDMKDRKYDYDLAALENERNAIKNEMETLKTVSKDNVDRTFKLFS